jgi:hypothetical protein
MLSSRLTLINLLLLGLVHGLFVRFTTPSLTIQPLLHSVFGIALLIYFLLTRHLLLRSPSRLAASGYLCLSLLIFGIVWSAGIVAATQFMSWLIATQGVSEASLFYGTSGTQFLTYSDSQVCWVLFLPVALIIFLTHRWFSKAR